MARLGEREREMIEVIYRLWGEKVGQRADGYPEVRVTPQPPEADDRSVFSRVINYRELQNYSAVLLLRRGGAIWSGVLGVEDADSCVELLGNRDRVIAVELSASISL